MLRRRNILGLATLIIMNVCACVCAHAQTDTIRYVHPNGKYSNDGRSWATATNRLQDAINDLRDYLAQNHLTSGSVYVAAGTYVPTESTEASGGSILNTSFNIYAGIHVYGGFNPDSPESSPGDRIMVNGKKCKDNWADPNGIGTTSGDSIASQWDLQYTTILTGNHTTGVPTFEFDSIRGRFNTTFPASSYHVVWFATNGKFETTNDSTKGHFRPLAHKASVDGCVISSGNASSKTTTTREHTAYGGGAYMVGNSELRNCIVERCNATMRGGGIYMDGGGVVEFCKVMQCQSPGIGVVQGYGGGVCIDYDGSIGHSHIMSNAARCGGGLAICHVPGEYPVQERIAAHIMPEDTAQISYYSPFSAACVINNNTANAEGGGIYLANGGTINHATVTANNCIGLDVTYYGRRHGRSGGIYIRDCGMIFNSVFWGNRCEANNDIQFASVRQMNNTDFEIYVYHSAFMNHDISDWTGVQKEMVFSLEKNNLPIEGVSGNYPCFFNPTVDPTDWSRISRSDSIYGPGVFMHMYPYYFPGPRLWHLTSFSALDQKGVQVTDAVQDASEWIRHAHTDYGVVTNPFEPVSTLGALVRRPDPMTYALVPPQGLEARNGATEPIPTLFIDPNREGVYDSVGNFDPQEKEGSSWKVPIRDLGEALQFFRQYLVDDEGGNHHYMIPALDSAGMATGEKTRYDYVQILVKEGKITTAGPGNYLDRNIRTAAIRLDSHMRLYGGYPSELEGTDTEGRNPLEHVSTITANITGIGGVRGYENNAAHVIAMVNVEHTIVDGFTLADANTHDVYLSQSAHAGGGVLVNNATTPQSKRIHMTGNQLRNCVITNCSSPKGAAVYVNGEWLNPEGDICYAELKMVNCVVRNNTADYEDNEHHIDDHGIITANGRAYIEIEHCNVVNNVGYPFKADDKQTDNSSASITCENLAHHGHILHGFIRVNNSIVFCNGDRPLDDRGQLGNVAQVMSVFPEGQNYVFGEYNMFDDDLRLHKLNPNQPIGFFTNGFQPDIWEDFVPEIPGNTTFGASLEAPLPAEKNNQALFTRTDINAETYPRFVNPSRNVGTSINGDKPLYGGTVSYAPMTTNPCVNAAGKTDLYSEAENYDRTDNAVRNGGGAPDIGAIENKDLPEMGSVIYVTPDGAGKRDGSSWGNAIAGNTIYALYGAGAAGTDQLDTENGTTRIINSDPNIGKGAANGVTTEDNRYCGGYATKYIFPIFQDYGTAYTRDVELKKYVGGSDDGKFDTLSINTTGSSTISIYKHVNGTIPDTIVSQKAINAAFPYGEMSGTSRYIFRATGNCTPFLEDGSSPKIGMSAPTNSRASAEALVATGQVVMTNERKENYVSGLQYAVEKASQINKTYHKDSVQVWVGAGKYSDYKGYVMRDSVSVYGGFPASKYRAPGMEERRALMSAVVAIPKSKENRNLDAEDYETILQISDVNPMSGTGTSAVINTAAINFYDNGQSVYLYIYNKMRRYTDNTTIQYYQWDEVIGDYVFDHTDNTEIQSQKDSIWWFDEFYDTTSKKRNYLRKRVLQMPDVTSPVFLDNLKPGQNTRGIFTGDHLAHFERVIKEGRLSNVKTGGAQTVNGRFQDPNYKEYNHVYWDGFTIRHGFLTNGQHQHTAGAGVAMFEGARLVNCIVTDNFVGCRGGKGGGVSCDGSTSTIENCFILNNTLTKGQYVEQSQMQGAGLFLYEGTCFNTLIANNWANGPGGGLALCVAKFYNNTVAYNYSNNSVGGVRICTGSEPAIFMANTIIYGNNAKAIDITSGSAATAPFINCYVQSVDQMNALFVNALTSHTPGVTDHYYGRKNTLLHKESPNASNTPFAADIVNGAYTGGSQPANDFSLRQKDGRTCINAGEEDFEGAMYEAVREYLQRNNASLNPTDEQIKNEMFYKNVVGVELPGNDVVYAKRVQDCQVDIGAYEFNAAFAIKPDTTTHPGRAIFYVCFSPRGGDASADSPKNAACKQKLQQVLDAAGRYKDNVMHRTYAGIPATPVAGQVDSTWTVEVWLEGDSVDATTSGIYNDWYTATRSTKHNVANYLDNTLDYSFIVPHGIQVMGGYSGNYYHYEDSEGHTVAEGTSGAHIVDERDPLTFRSVLSGKITSSTGAVGNTFHVVTFTNDLFTPDEDLYTDELDNPITDQLAAMTAERHRAVLDGLFIEDGLANAPDSADCIGAGAVVTEYAHIRNCVVQNNEAQYYGGGLYLKPNALVSGTIIKKNTADIGGGIYIESPAGANDSIRGANSAHVYTTTICENHANTTAGGMWFDNTYARVNSTALWHNKANDYANVSGVFSRSENSKDYPFAYCAVESRRLEGQGNLELSPSETEGVRWDRQDPFNAILYYPIEMSSTLSRAGMTYMEWYETMARYTTLDTTDIAGVSRTKWLIDGVKRNYAWGEDTLVTKNNDFIEIGARAVNKNFAIKVDSRYVMHRLYVMHTELLNSEAARALQDNTATDDASNMYRQMGSCMLNPFHRLGDAFEYIIAARRMNPAEYRNRVFEVFIEKGTYFPYHNAYGEQDQVRNSTFLVPEAVYVIGGVNSQMAGHSYGQEGYFDLFTDHSIDIGTDSADLVINGHTDKGDFSYTINYAPLDTIRLRDENHRPMRDVNLNSVIEPWELDRQTIFSGNAVAGEDFTHVYHVVTMHADSDYVGPQPYKFYRTNPNYGKPGEPDSAKMFLLKDTIPFSKPDSFYLECLESILARTTEYDGIQITGGYANHLNESDISHVYATKTYFRGGGILVDGNWTRGYEAGQALPTVTEQAKYNIPIIVENCYFSQNMAANGGALYSNGGIYMFGCHFTQNYSQGPVTKLDQQYIPWTAGGCIATNATCNISNTLFDNNEARRGLYPIPDDNTLLEVKIPDADARQGFGGVLSVADKARMRVVNCHFMRNKAVAYPSIYNFNPNNKYSTADSMQFAFNTIFWGNEVFEVDNLSELEHIESVPQASIDAFNNTYKGSRTGVFHYDPEEWQTYERLYQEYDSLYKVYSTPASIEVIADTFNVKVINKLKELRDQGQKMEGLYFCSYRKGYGPSAMKPTKEGYLLLRDATHDETNANFVDPRNTPVRLAYNSFTRNYTERYDSLWYWVRGNNNVIINRSNTATDGPNFRQPSLVAGIDGYMQNADWLLARMNLTTDQGWGHLTQNVTRDTSYYITKFTGSEQFATREAASTAALANKPDSVDASDLYQYIYPIKGMPTATFVDSVQELAIYNFYAKRYGTYTSKTNPPLPLGNQYYMVYSRYTDEDEQVGAMDRISKNPRLGEKDVYIDVGVYEYQYVQLDIKGQEIDTMWVSTTEKAARHDGMAWETPTTDLQTAIDVLMSSHNNHDKYICFLGDAEQTFSPSNILNNRRTFLITSNSLTPMMPDSAMSDFDYGVKSLTFLGGYSPEIKDAKRDPIANPTIIEMPGVGNQAQLNQLFVIEDMTRQMVQANFQGEDIRRENTVIPIVFDGLTFANPYSTQDNTEGGLMNQKGGAAIYYRWQRRYESSGQGDVHTPNMNMALYPDSVEVDGHMVALPKLTLSNCIFMDNGSRTAPLDNRSSAVRIDHGGGSSLIVNSLFHSNAGAPVYAPHYDHVEGESNLAYVPNDVIVVNSTFALNDGHLTLKSDHSEVHNSLIWRDDLANDTAADAQLVQLELDGDQWDNTTNRNKPGIADRMTNNAIWGCFREGDETYHNDSLSTNNSDVYEGPNFTKPIVEAATSEQRRQRDFTLKPSAKTMNMADTTVYKDRVFFRMYPDTCAETDGKYWRRSNGFKSVPIYSLMNDSDLAAKPRLFGAGMERGAYECRAVLQRVLYVNPNTPEFSAGDGSSWQHPFGTGQLQDAINAASLYTYLNRTADEETRKAYIFVKGSNAANDSLMARDGVNLYGSVPSYINDTAWMNPDSATFTNGECQRYVNFIRSVVPGVASPGANTTKIRSVQSTGDDFSIGFLIDGFVITNPDSAISRSPIVLDNTGTVMRNSIITNNRVKNGQPVVDVSRGLLYNSLVYNDSAAVLVKVGANGLVLNNTILTNSAAVQTIDSTEAVADAIVNNIEGLTDGLYCFVPYLSQKNPYTLPTPLVEQGEVLNYQLHERSRMINGGREPLPATFDDYVADSVICFGRDRDILGNPRKTGSRVDMGALEAWLVEPGTDVEITALTNEVIDTRVTTADYNTLRKAFTEHFGGNAYPHPGSVVYLMDSSSMSMQYENTEKIDFVDRRHNVIVFKPAYMLLKPGASFYGNGHDVQLSYLAAEKRFVNQQYSMTAFPFDYSKANITVTGYNAEKDSLIANLSTLNFNTYQYSGAARSAKDYVFKMEKSSSWLPVDTLNRTATDGYLMDFGSAQDTVLRFNAFAATTNNYVYTENGDDKTIYLDQHDHRTGGTGETLDFTRREDMGWNMKGLPWLVSYYRTDTVLWVGNYLRQMYIPHVIYQMDGSEYGIAGDQAYTLRSWDDGAFVAMGNAFLTQTARQGERETVIFHLPYYDKNKKVARPIVTISPTPKVSAPAPAPAHTPALGKRHTTPIADMLTLMPDSNASKNVQYAYGRDGIKWGANDSLPQMYALDSKRLSRISLLGAAPTEVDIPVGVKVPETYEGYAFSFHLPAKEAFTEYRYVWLIDYQKNKFINLLEEDYTADIEPGENNKRFAIRIGGFPKTDEKGKRQYVVYTYEGSLHVRGLVAGDRITVYSPSGKLVHQAISSGYEYSTPLILQNGYVVKVNDKAHKVLNM